MNYRGRFAPSPSGPLHFGSLIAALASYLQAKKHDGIWLVRIEDIDLPRTVAGIDKIILKTLEAFHLYWDETVVYQSQRQQRYEEVILELQQKNHIYPCSCNRKEIGSKIYPGRCRLGVGNKKKPASLRIKVNNQTVSFIDSLSAEFSQRLDQDVGDFILKRTDQMIAYNLAVVVDDFEQSVTEIVRGHDLIDTTPRQIYLQQVLGFTTPSYLHFPVAIDQSGNKLSKQNHAPAVNTNNCKNLLIDALNFLGQSPSTKLNDANIDELLQWSIKHWDINNVPKRNTITYLAD